MFDCSQAIVIECDTVSYRYTVAPNAMTLMYAHEYTSNIVRTGYFASITNTHMPATAHTKCSYSRPACEIVAS